MTEGPPVSLVKSGGQQSGMPGLKWALGRGVSTCVSRVSPSFQCSAFTVTIGKSAFRALGSALHLGDVDGRASLWSGIHLTEHSKSIFPCLSIMVVTVKSTLRAAGVQFTSQVVPRQLEPTLLWLSGYKAGQYNPEVSTNASISRLYIDGASRYHFWGAYLTNGRYLILSPSGKRGTFSPATQSGPNTSWAMETFGQSMTPVILILSYS